MKPQSREVFPGIAESDWSALPLAMSPVIEACANACITSQPCLIIGPSGSGKSTLASAVLNHYLGDRRDEALFEMTFHPGLSPMVVLGGPDLPALVEGRYVITTRGAMIDPSHRAILIDELPLGSMAVLDAMLRVADMPGRPILATANMRVPVGNVAQAYWEALLDRFGTCYVPPHRVLGDDSGYDMSSVSLNLSSERFRAMRDNEMPRRGIEIDLSRFRLPRIDEMEAFYQSLLASEHPISVAPEVRDALNDLISALAAGGASSGPHHVITVNHRNATAMSQSLVLIALFEQWRTIDKDAWQTIYDEPDATRRASWWNEYASNAARTSGWTNINRVSEWNARNIAVVIPTANVQTAMWVVDVVLTALRPIITRSPKHHLASQLLHAVQRMDLAMYHALTTSQFDVMIEAAERRGSFDAEEHLIAQIAYAMRAVVLEILSEHGSTHEQTFFRQIMESLTQIAGNRGLAIAGHRPMHALCMKIKMDQWPPSEKDQQIIDALADAYDEAYRAVQASSGMRVRPLKR